MTQPKLEPSPAGPPLDQFHVADAMHRGVITCAVETPLREVARLMATHRIHAVVTFGEGAADAAADSWGVVSDLDLVRAARAADFEACLAGEIAASPVVMVQPDDELAKAAQLMDEHDVAHVVVSDARSGRPIGVLSTLDVARELGGSASESRCRQ